MHRKKWRTSANRESAASKVFECEMETAILETIKVRCSRAILPRMVTYDCKSDVGDGHDVLVEVFQKINIAVVKLVPITCDGRSCSMNQHGTVVR